MKIVITESKDYSEKALSVYRGMGEVVECENLTREELLKMTCDANLVIGRLSHEFDREFFENANKLQAIGTPTTGLDHIDRKIAKEAGVSIYSLRGEQAFLESIAATPEHTLALLLSSLRKIPQAASHVRSRAWDRNLFKGREIKGSTVGLYGFGRVARLFACFLKTMGARIIAYDPYVDVSVMKDHGVEFVSRDDLFKQSQILSIHALLTSETEGSINKDELCLLPFGACIVNTARGQIIDEEALVECLKSGHVSSVATDVLSCEREGEGWYENSPLWVYSQNHDNVIITPHIAGATYDSMHSTEEFIAKKCKRFMTGDKSIFQENKLFDDKWMEAITKRKGQEFSLFVPEGEKPLTQRQFNLYNYMEYIDKLIEGRGFTSSLELGAGRGTISLYLRKRHKFDVTLNDISDNAMELARANFQYFNEPAEFQVGDASCLPYPDNSFDVVVSIGLLEHLDDYSGVLRESYRVLKPGGVMVQINIPKKNSIQILNSAYRAVLSRFGVRLREDYHRNEDKPIDYANHTKEAGFVNVETMNVNPFPLFVPLPMFVDRVLALVYRGILSIRKLWSTYPFKTNYSFSQCHFLVGLKGERNSSLEKDEDISQVKEQESIREIQKV